MSRPRSLSQELTYSIKNTYPFPAYRMAAVRALRYYTISEVRFQYKVSSRTLYRWKKKWKETVTGRQTEDGTSIEAEYYC